MDLISGLSTLLLEHAIDDGEVVCGAKFDDDGFGVLHDFAETNVH